MKKYLQEVGWMIGLVALIGLCVVKVAGAVDESFVVSVNIKAASSTQIKVSRINTAVTPQVWTPVATSELSFNPDFNAQFGIYADPNIYALDISPVGGSARITTTFQFTPGAIPPGQKQNLGDKMTLTLVKTTGSGTNTTDQLLSQGKMRLNSLNGTVVTPEQISGGWLRGYLAMATGDPAATPPEPAGTSPFTAADFPGRYDATLLISATVE